MVAAKDLCFNPAYIREGEFKGKDYRLNQKTKGKEKAKFEMIHETACCMSATMAVRN
jgi:hypothetical protein